MPKMTELRPPHDPIDALGQPYELLLEKALAKARQRGTIVDHLTNEIRGDVEAITEFNDKEVVNLEEYVKRDLINAAQYLDKTGKELADWLGFDVTLIKHEFWKIFSEATDQTTLTLNQLKQQAATAEYHSGELVGLGILVCDQCDEKLHFHKPGHIPPCPKCKSTRFHRRVFE